MMVKKLDELIKNRKDLIDAHKKNDFTDGIHALLTDLYPDTAHFIYELLQNAEDMNATKVRFILDDTSIDFEHNGTKRNFNLADIDAITNIGHNSQKKDDPTSIGKFGVGFKAVFAYTSTPEIHSGDYHFRIKDYFVPDFEGVRHISTRDADGSEWTKFSFPFNNPNKPKEVAYRETLEGLQQLDDTSILFLQNINKIEYMLPNSDFGYVERLSIDEHKTKIVSKKYNQNNATESKWLKFCKPIEIIDDQSNLKKLTIAVAYALETDKKTNKEKIVAVKCGGKTFIYFPAEKEHSGLRFHINAPFASTVARDSVRNCNDNIKLIKKIGELVSDSISEIKKMGLLNVSFFDVLPNNKDGLSLAFYDTILDYVIATFQNNEYLPTKNNTFVSAKKGLIGSAAVSNLLKESILYELLSLEKIWVVNAPQRNSNADNFIHSLDIEEFTIKSFVELFKLGQRPRTEAVLEKQSDEWLKLFYSHCSDVYNDLPFREDKEFIELLKEIHLIRTNDNTMCLPSECFILPTNTRLVTKSTPIIKPFFVSSAVKKDRDSEKIENFFSYDLGVAEYGPNVEIEKLLSKYKNETWHINEEYYLDLITFAKFNNCDAEIDFSEYKLFLSRTSQDKKLCRNKANEMYLGKVYNNNDGERLSVLLDYPLLSELYKERYTPDELELFLKFARACGMKSTLTIQRQSAIENPKFLYELDSEGRHTDSGYDSDYAIPDLVELLETDSPKASKVIWNTLLSNRSEATRYCRARYSINGQAIVKECDSTLIYYLKKYAWIPNKSNELFKPADIEIKDIRSDLKYDEGNALFKALEIGSSFTKANQQKEKLVAEADKLGMKLISSEDYKMLQEAKAKQKKQSNTDVLSSKELLEKQNKNPKNNLNGDDDFSTDGAVNNLKKRESNIEASFNNARQMPPKERKLFSRISESNKEEKNSLRFWYGGVCQMCDTKITGYDQQPHFVAKNIISTSHLENSIRATTEMAWNSLCLCPNCAAKYDVCSRDLNGLYEQIISEEVIEHSSEPIFLKIVLDGKEQKIRYIPKHFLALQKAIKLIDESVDKEPE